MFVVLSKIIPPFIYPLGLACLLVVAALLLSRRRRWQQASLLFALALLWFSSTRWTAAILARSLEWQYLPPPVLQQIPPGGFTQPVVDVIVVLGGGTSPALPPRPLVDINGAGDRVIYGAYLYKQGAAPHLLLSGGNIDWLSVGETPAQDMAKLMALMEVPQEALWLETKSRNTYENAAFSWDFLSQKGIRRIMLVTSAMHMPRAAALFRHQGFEVIPAPTDYSITETDWQSMLSASPPAQLLNLLPSAGDLATTSSVMKEYLGIFVYRLRGWL